MKSIILIIATFFCCLKLSYTQSGKVNSPHQINNSVTADSAPALTSTLPDIKYHLTARPWKALNISRDAYLDKVEGIVRQIVKFQNSRGAIVDPYLHREEQYSTPYFANAVGTLISADRAMDLLDEGVAAMNSATSDVAGGVSSIPDRHGEFFLAPLAGAIPLYASHVSPLQLQIWKIRMAKPIKEVIESRPHNWRTYAMKGEWYRAKNGYVNKDTAVSWIENSWIKTQKGRITNNSWNFYHDKSSNPDTWPYESVARSNLLEMIFEGYNGASRNEILRILKNGTQSSLLLQDPSGQIAAGGRSGNNTWNDLLLTNGYETMAEIAYKDGNTRLAGQYRHAAALGFQSAQRWRRPDATYSVTKNHFNPADRIRYANYSFFTHYNGNMMYHMSENYLRHKSSIPEQAAPNEIGGYTMLTDENFATAVANAGGMHMQVCLRGSTAVKFDRYWTTLGVVRFARPGWDSRLGPSDGVREETSNLGVSFAPAFLENGKWVRLASLPYRYEAFFTTQFTHPLLVRCRVVYKPKSGKTGPTFTNDFIITPDGILSTITSASANFGVTWPILTFDGAANLTNSLTSHIASTSFPNSTDQQNFIALHSAPIITASDTAIRSSYGDLRPVRMVSGTTSNVSFIYPRDSADPTAETVRKSYTRSANNFSTVLGRVRGNTYIGRTSAGGVGTTMDVDNDGTAEVSFNMTTGFLMQLKVGEITKIETDRDVTAVIYRKTVNLKAYTPVNISNPLKAAIVKVVANTDDGNVAANTIDRDYSTRWSAKGDSNWIRYYLDRTAIIKTVRIAWYRGNERQASFDIQTSSDTTNWKTAFSGHSSGNTTSFETYNILLTSARYIRIVGHGNNLNSWNAITETEILRDAGLPQTLDPNPPLIVAMSHLDRAQTFTDKASYPRSSNPDGTIKRVTASDWTSGFFPGSLWLMYENTKDQIWRTRAEQWTAALEGQKNDTSTHDLGYILSSSFGNGYRLTGNEKYKDILLQGAKSLATRFNPIAGCIKSWDNPNFAFPVLIDNMANLEILFLATKVSGDSSYYKIAVKHALTTIANHFRPDNSSYHLVDYNPNNGNVISRVTVQGLNNMSDWARGQAWGLYGFTVCYRETGDIRFLNMAKKIADFYIMQPNMPADLVPFWDFDAFDYRDASAASIAGSALLELSQFAPEKRTTYYNYGINILKSLSSSNYIAAAGTNNNFVLKHCVGNKPRNIEVNKPLCFADYYFIQALLRYKKPAPMLTAIAGNSRINLKWNQSTGAKYYSIKRSSVSGGPYTTIASNITKTTYINTGLTAGKTYYYIVTSWNAIGEGGASAEASAATNKAPAVSIINPVNNQNFNSQDTIRLVAAVKDLDGTISIVRFYNGTTLLRTVCCYPYTYTWYNMQAGSYTITAVATDNKGLSATSAPVTVTVTKSSLPMVSGRPSSVSNETRLSGSISLKLSPNPARSALYIHTNGLQRDKQVTISVVSASGSIIKTFRAKASFELDVSTLGRGVYSIKVISGEKVMSRQFVKL